MPQQQALALALVALMSLAALPALAQTAPATPANSQPAAEQVIQPQVQRREIKRPEYPSNDFSITAFGGFYSVENFGTSSVSGVRLGYHITEDFFAEGTYGRTTLSDEAYRVGRPGGILPQPTAPLTYYNVVVGYNLLTGEAFFGRNLAKATQGYVVLGAGSTKYANQTWQTVTTGFGLRLIVKNWFALQADVRDHVFSNDLLGTRKSTHNPEITAGLTLIF